MSDATGQQQVGPGLPARLAAASWEDPKPFAERLLEILVDELRLTAASFWLYTNASQPLRLRAQIGLPPAAYESFELELSHFPGEAILSGKVLAIGADVLRHSSRYRDVRALPSDQQGMVTGAITVPQNSPTMRELVGVTGAIGALCLYPRHAEDLQPLRRWLATDGEFLGRLYLAALERYAMGLRRTIVEKVAFRSDLNSLEHNFLRFALRELAVDAAQLWIVEPTHRVVYLHRTLGLPRPPKVNEEQPLTMDDPGVVMRCFSSNVPLIHSGGWPLDGADVLARGLDAPLSNALLVPLPLLAKARLRGEAVTSAGVLVLLNHRATVGDVRHLTMATWEDRHLAQFSCEMLAVLLYQMLKSGNHESDFERLMHGARRSLQTPLQNLLGLDYAAIDASLPPNQRGFIAESIFWLEDLAAQIDRNELIGEEDMKITGLHLHNAVLWKVAAMARRMPPRPPAGRVEVTGLENSIHNRTLPPIRGNVAALTSVFRNLVENSVKYAVRAPGIRPEVHFDSKTSPDATMLIVDVSDNGIGIPDSERELIFRDGYRSAVARRHVPDGVGRGLYDCRTLLQRMDGTIELLPSQPTARGAHFRVSLRIAPRRRRQ